MKTINFRSLDALADALAKGETTAQDLCRHYIAEVQRLNPSINAMIDLDEAAVMAAAAVSDARRAAGSPLSPYDGIPIALKDNVSATGESFRCASKILDNFRAVFDATVVLKLKAAGMIPFGRANMDEFAMGSTCQNSAYASTRNPWDTLRVPGGSSGGSAAAVSAGMAPVALGSDTGGSIRQPAAFCGIVGFKPAYGTVSRFGVGAFASSLDQVGPMANSVRDCARIYDIIRGKDSNDATSYDVPAFDPVLPKDQSLKGFRIGVPKEFVAEGSLAPEVRKTFETTIAQLKALGAEMIELSIPSLKYCVSVYYILSTAEASANLAKFDGIRYGSRADTKDVNTLYRKTRGDFLGPEVKRRIILGTYVLSSGYYDAYYLRAQKVRTLIINDVNSALAQCDCILSPVSPDLTPKVDDFVVSDPLKLALADVFTTLLNLAGGAGISLPVALDDATKIPIGVQLLSTAEGTQNLFKAAAALEDKISSQWVPGIN